MTIHIKCDFSGWTHGLEKLRGPLREYLARSMAVAGGKVVRDEAKALAPVGMLEGGSIRPGSLRDAIYLTCKTAYSNDKRVTYAVSWDATMAPYGNLVEFGYWKTEDNIEIQSGEGISIDKPNNSPRWVAAHPFLRPAFDITRESAVETMFTRGKARLCELLAEQSAGGGEGAA